MDQRVSEPAIRFMRLSVTNCRTFVQGSNPETPVGTGFAADSSTNYSSIPQSTPENVGFVPDRLCPRCQRWTEGRPWGGSSKLYGYQCACGHQWVDTSLGVKAARERVRESRKQRGGR